MVLVLNIAGTLVATFFNNTLTRPLVLLQEAVANIARGDLSVQEVSSSVEKISVRTFNIYFYS